MTYFQDGTTYSYLQEVVDGSVNIGWLDETEPFPTGDVPPDFVTRLVGLCGEPVNLTRGYHYCNLCPSPEGDDYPEPVTVTTPDGDVTVGHGEIRVTGGDGVTYASPDLVAHYVTAHRYRPPREFVDAVIASQ